MRKGVTSIEVARERRAFLHGIGFTLRQHTAVETLSKAFTDGGTLRTAYPFDHVSIFDEYGRERALYRIDWD